MLESRTAGRGIVHSETPVRADGEVIHGFQLWVNLPSSKKMMKPQCVTQPPTLHFPLPFSSPPPSTPAPTPTP